MVSRFMGLDVKLHNMEYIPSLLPEVDAVEVVDLRGIIANRINEYMAGGIFAPNVRVTDEKAQLLAHLWRQLSAAGQMRCHIPPFGFRFYHSGALLLQASVCWRCNNIFIKMDEKDLSYQFNGMDANAQELLALANEIMGLNSR